MKFPKSKRLLKRRDFEAVRKTGLVFTTESLFFSFKKSSPGKFRAGITVSKKIGKAHVRNRLKRQLRELIRLNALSLPLWMEIRPKRSALTKSFALLQNEITSMTERYAPQPVSTP